MKKASVLSEMLLPQGFVKKKGVFLRNCLNESVQVIQLVPDSFSRSNVTISVFSIYQEQVRTWIRAPKTFPANYQVTAFEARSQGFLPLSDSEETEILKTTVIPTLNRISSQDQLLSLMRSLDAAAFGDGYLLNEIRIYPALAAKQYVEANRIIEAILQQHRDAESSMKKHLSSSEFADYSSSSRMKEQSMIQIKAWIENGETHLIEQFLECAKINNLSALAENGIARFGT